MRKFYVAASVPLVLAALTVLGLTGSGPAARSPAAAIEVDPVVWQFDRDYPAEILGDESLPISNVYIKTHDGTDWMSTYDPSPNAVNGPASILALKDKYAERGVEVSAWFVPKGTDFNAQVLMAVQVIDTGVEALYADVEPYQGFCYLDCQALADQFWAKVHELRPNAKLGVIYDPRPWWWAEQALDRWFASSDVALPMCYWEGYVNQDPWDDPAGCVVQAHEDLKILSPGHSLEYAPMLQGDSTPAAVMQAIDAAALLGSTNVSMWRRGVTSNAVWDMIASYQDRQGPNCEQTLADGCLVREAGEAGVFMLQGQTFFGFPSLDSFNEMGGDWRAIQVVPRGFIAGLSNWPVDGTLVRDFDDARVWVIEGGARFHIPDPETFQAMNYDPYKIRIVPRGTVSRLSLSPTDFTRVQEFGSVDQFVVVNGGRMSIDESILIALTNAGRAADPVHVLPPGAFNQIGVAQIRRGDVDCSGEIGAGDVINILAFSASLPQAGLCTHFTGDVDCDGSELTVDGLLILLYLIGQNHVSAEGCLPIGEPQSAPVPTPAPTPSPVPTDVPTSTAAPSDTPVDTDAPTASPPETVAPSDTATPVETATPTVSPLPSATPTISATPAQ